MIAGNQKLKRCISVLLSLVMLLGLLLSNNSLGNAESSPFTNGSRPWTPTTPYESMIDETKDYILYSLHVDCSSWFAPKADGSLLSLGTELDFPSNPEGLKWRFEHVSENAYKVSNNGVYLKISEGKLVLSSEPATVFLIETGDGFYLGDKDGEYVISAGYTSSHRLVVVKKSNPAARPFYIEEVRDPSGVNPLRPKEYFSAKIMAPTEVYGDGMFVIFAKDSDGSYYAINAAGSPSKALELDGELKAGDLIHSPDTDVLWTINNGRNGNTDIGTPKYIRSTAEIDGKYLAAASDGVVVPVYSSSNLNFVFNDDGLSVSLISDDGRAIVLKDGKFTATDREKATAFYFARLQRDELQDAGVLADVPEGTLLKLVDWSDVKLDGKTRYALINASEFNYLHHAVTGKGRINETGVNNITDDWNGHEWNMDPVSLRTTEICPFQIGDYLHTVSGEEILWTVVERNGRYIFKNAGTGLYLAPDEGVNKVQSPAISEIVKLLTVEQSGKVIYLSRNGNYLDLWRYYAVSSAEKNDVENAFFIAELVSDDETPATDVPAGEKDDLYFGGANSLFQSSQHSIGNGIFSTGVNAHLMMNTQKGESSFLPAADGSNFDLTFCADAEADMPINIRELVKYKRVNIDDDEANEKYNFYSKEQRVKMKAMAPNAYPYISAERMLQAMKEAGFAVSEYCGGDEMLAGFQAAIYNITNPITDDDGNETGELWGYTGSDMQHNNYEFNRSERYVADGAVAASDINTIRDYLLSLAEKSLTETLSNGLPDAMTPVDTDLFALVTEINGRLYALDAYQFLGPYEDNNIKQLWYEDEEGWIRSSYNNYILSVQYSSTLYPKTSSRDAYISKVSCSLQNYANYVYDSYISSYSTNSYMTVYEYFPIRLGDDGRLRTDISDFHGLLSVPSNKANLITSEEIDALLRESFTPQYITANSSSYVYLTSEQNSARVFTSEKPTLTEPYALEDYELTVKDNGDGTYTLTVTGTLSRPVRDSDFVRIWLIAESKNERKMITEFVPKGSDRVQLTLPSIPDEMEYTFVISYLIPDMNVYIYYPDAPGWVVDDYQTQFGMAYNASYAEYYLGSTSIPVEKTWTDGNTDHEPIQAELLDENGKVVSTVTLSKENNWKGRFAHVPSKTWTYRQYDLGYYEDPTNIDYIPNGYGMVPLGHFRYTMSEPLVEGYTPSYELLADYKKIPHSLFPISGQTIFSHIVIDSEQGIVISRNPNSGYYEPPFIISEFDAETYEQMFPLDGSMLMGIYATDSSYSSGGMWMVRPYAEDKFVLSMPGPYGAQYLACDLNTLRTYLVDDIEDALVFELWYSQSFENEYNRNPADGDRRLLTFRYEDEFEDTVIGMDYILMPLGMSQSYHYTTSGFYPALEILLQSMSYPAEFDIMSMLKWEVGENGVLRATLFNPSNPQETISGTLMICKVEVEYECASSSFDPISVYELWFINDDDKDAPIVEEDWYYDYSIRDDVWVTTTITPVAPAVLKDGLLGAEIGDGISLYLALGFDDSPLELVPERERAVQCAFANYIPDRITAGGFISNTPNGELVISKTVSGSDGDTTMAFPFTVTLSGKYTGSDGREHDASEINGVYGEMKFVNGVAEFTLKHGESIYAVDLPAGLTYKVTESGNEGYRVMVTGDIIENGGEGTVPEKGKNNAFVAFTNHKDLIPGGDLTVTKFVNGTSGDTNKPFAFTVVLSGKYIGSDGMEHDASEINGVYGNMEFENGIATFKLKDGERMTALGLPVGITYNVVETENEGYDVTIQDDEGVIEENETAAAIFVNHSDAPCGSSGGASLTVNKMVSGSASSTEDEFPFTVTLSDRTVNGVYGDMEFVNGVANFTLKHGEFKTATGLPAGITYTVIETDHKGYDLSASGEEGVLSEDKPAVAMFVNNDCAHSPATETQKPPIPGTNPGTGDTGAKLLLFPIAAVFVMCIFLLIQSMDLRKKSKR